MLKDLFNLVLNEVWTVQAAVHQSATYNIVEIKFISSKDHNLICAVCAHDSCHMLRGAGAKAHHRQA